MLRPCSCTASSSRPCSPAQLWAWSAPLPAILRRKFHGHWTDFRCHQTEGNWTCWKGAIRGMGTGGMGHGAWGIGHGAWSLAMATLRALWKNLSQLWLPTVAAVAFIALGSVCVCFLLFPSHILPFFLFPFFFCIFLSKTLPHEYIEKHIHIYRKWLPTAAPTKVVGWVGGWVARPYPASAPAFIHSCDC